MKRLLYTFHLVWTRINFIPGRQKEYPICLDGNLSRPPEDCGGVGGYYECIEALINYDDSEGLLSWLGDWRPDDFNPKRVVFESPR